jgi:bifunctional enzyme CysN/CysC
MDWYGGPTLLYHLETVSIAADRNLVDFRFPVQLALRPHQDFRGLAGTVVSGGFRVGDEVLALPSGRQSRVRSISTPDGISESAAAGDAVVVELADDVDVSRGDMLVRPGNLPEVATELDAIICWMTDHPLVVGRGYVMRHTTREVRAVVDQLRYAVDVDTLHRNPASSLTLNEIARVHLRVAKPLFFDAYTVNRETGGFILIDPETHETVAAGMLRGPAREAADVLEEVGLEGSGAPTAPVVSSDVVWESPAVPREEREERAGHRAAVVWLTGLSGAGKSTIARALERALYDAGVNTALLDGDVLRHGLTRDLGFTPEDRRENIRRAGEAARLFFEHGHVVICAFVSPYAEDRAAARALFPAGRFFEVHVDVDVETARARDPKGLYGRAAAGELASLTGVSAPYETPSDPELALQTASMTVDESVRRIRSVLQEAGIVRGS